MLLDLRSLAEDAHADLPPIVGTRFLAHVVGRRDGRAVYAATCNRLFAPGKRVLARPAGREAGRAAYATSSCAPDALDTFTGRHPARIVGQRSGRTVYAAKPCRCRVLIYARYSSFEYEGLRDFYAALFGVCDVTYIRPNAAELPAGIDLDQFDLVFFLTNDDYDDFISPEELRNWGIGLGGGGPLPQRHLVLVGGPNPTFTAANAILNEVFPGGPLTVVFSETDNIDGSSVFWPLVYERHPLVQYLYELESPSAACQVAMSAGFAICIPTFVAGRPVHQTAAIYCLSNPGQHTGGICSGCVDADDCAVNFRGIVLGNGTAIGRPFWFQSSYPVSVESGLGNLKAVTAVSFPGFFANLDDSRKQLILRRMATLNPCVPQQPCAVVARGTELTLAEFETYTGGPVTMDVEYFHAQGPLGMVWPSILGKSIPPDHFGSESLAHCGSLGGDRFWWKRTETEFFSDIGGRFVNVRADRTWLVSLDLDGCVAAYYWQEFSTLDTFFANLWTSSIFFSAQAQNSPPSYGQRLLFERRNLVNGLCVEAGACTDSDFSIPAGGIDLKTVASGDIRVY